MGDACIDLVGLGLVGGGRRSRRYPEGRWVERLQVGRAKGIVVDRVQRWEAFAGWAARAGSKCLDAGSRMEGRGESGQEDWFAVVQVESPNPAASTK